ncbi:MAG: DUF6502 family protein [Steroidobacteraceae bacterium]
MSAPRGDVRPVVRKALLQLLEPLTAFVIDAGLSAGDLNLLLREASVRSLARRQLENSPRINISGIAATTGIPRAEISRILKQNNEGRRADRRQQSTNRILAAWHGEPKFIDRNGQPAILKIYGRGTTFESLVKSFGGGIPPRAVLDELLRARVVKVLPDQRIQARGYLSGSSGLSLQAIKAFGDRASDLFSTMLYNMRTPETPRFLATVALPAGKKELLPLIRKKISNRSAEFVSEMQETSAVALRKRGSNTVGVTVFYHESTRASHSRRSPTSRTNFRRRPIR